MRHKSQASPLRPFIFDALSKALSEWGTDQVTLATQWPPGAIEELEQARIMERQAGSTLYRFHDHFMARAVALIMDLHFPEPGKKPVSEKASKSPDAYSLSVIKQAAKTMRYEMDEHGIEPTEIKELWPALCLTDEGFFLVPDVAIYESGKARDDFTAEEREQYRVSLDGKEG